PSLAVTSTAFITAPLPLAMACKGGQPKDGLILNVLLICSQRNNYFNNRMTMCVLCAGDVVYEVAHQHKGIKISRMDGSFDLLNLYTGINELWGLQYSCCMVIVGIEWSFNQIVDNANVNVLLQQLTCPGSISGRRNLLSFSKLWPLLQSFFGWTH
ncbi:hypothetical protein Tco_1288793, partial [Tanacetum coccineum]